MASLGTYPHVFPHFVPCSNLTQTVSFPWTLHLLFFQPELSSRHFSHNFFAWVNSAHFSYLSLNPFSSRKPSLTPQVWKGISFKSSIPTQVKHHFPIELYLPFYLFTAHVEL